MNGIRAHASALTAAVFALSSFLSPSASAQNSRLEDALRQFSATDARGYTQPLADALISNLSSGYFATSRPRMGFGLSLELLAMGTSITDKMRTYQARTPAGFAPSSFTAPTAFGGKGTTVQHSTVQGLSYRATDGVLDAKLFPTPVPQVRVSGLLNTEVVLRFADSDWLGGVYPKEELSQLQIKGVGVRHGISQYLGLPVDIAVSGSYNTLTLGDYIEVKNTTFGVNAGKQFNVLSVMGGLESSGGTMNLKFPSTNPEQAGPVNIDVESKRQVRLTGGATLDFKVVKLFGTASIGKFTTFSGGLRLGF